MSRIDRSGPVVAWVAFGLVGAFVGSSRPWGVVSVVVVALVLSGSAAASLDVGASLARRVLLGGLVVGCALGIGAQARLSMAGSGPAVQWAWRGGQVEVALMVVTEPRVSEDGWWAVARLERVGEQQDRERGLLRGEGEPPALWASWVGPATARPIDDARPFERYVATLHAAVVVDPSGLGVWSPPGPLGASTQWLRVRIRRAAGADRSVDAAGLVVGLATGDTSGLSARAQDELRGAGLSHLTAVSGSNVALVVAAVLALVQVLPLGPVGRQLGVLVAVGWFAVLTRFEPSVLRASVMVAVLAMASARRTIGDGVHALATAVLLLLLIDPMLSRSLGLLLSAGAAAGILLLVPVLQERLGWVTPVLRLPLAVTLAAQIGVAPVLLVVESEVGLSDIPANLMAVPLAMVASLVGGAGALLAVVHPMLGAPLLWAARAPASGILAIAHALAGRGPVVGLARPLTLVIVVALLVVVMGRRGGGERRWAGAVAGVLSLVWLVPVHTSAVRTLTVTAIDVGQGDAVLVEVPGGIRMLVDGGGDDRAATWLRQHGVDHIDLVVVTHPHLDHIGGIPAVLSSIKVDALWQRPVPTTLPEAAEVDRLVVAHDIPVTLPHSGQVAVLGAMRIEVIGPARGRPFSWSDSELNDTSIVLRVEWQGRSALLTGDAEHAAQEAMLVEASRLEAGLLKVPHHGGSTSLPAFLSAVHAQVAIISVGKGNRYGHPRPEVLSQLEDAGVEVLRTDQMGTVRVLVPPPRQKRSDLSMAPVGSVGVLQRSAHRGRPGHPRHSQRRPSAPARVRGRAGRTSRSPSRFRRRHPPRARARAPA